MTRREPIILNVNDFEPARYIATRILRLAGFQVVEADNGLMALENVKQRPDLILLDVRLPHLDGLEVCRQVKASAATRGIPVLHTSAALQREALEQETQAVGSDGFLVQPFTAEELVGRVKALLGMAASD